MHTTTVTCHECQMQHTLYTVEWPPQMFACSRCDSIFALTAISPDNEPIFSLTGYCRFIS